MLILGIAVQVITLGEMLTEATAKSARDPSLKYKYTLKDYDITIEGLTIFEIVNCILNDLELMSEGNKLFILILFGEVDFVIEVDPIVHPLSQKSPFVMFGPDALTIFQFDEKSI